MYKTAQALLWASCILIGVGAHDAAQSRNRGVGVSVGGKNGINANVSANTRNGLDAHVSASVGGKKGVDADVDADTGKNVNANVGASVGGTNGVNADVDASVGGTNGVDANASVNGVDTNLGRVNAVNPDQPGVTGKDTTVGRRSTLTASQLQAFNAMSDSEKKAMLKSCLSVGAGGYDPALVNLCKLLRMSASR